MVPFWVRGTRFLRGTGGFGLRRGLNNLFGARAEHDRLPARLLQALDSGPTEGGSPDMDLMLAEFYELRGLDDEGIPRREILRSLGLDDLADLLADLLSV